MFATEPGHFSYALNSVYKLFTNLAEGNNACALLGTDSPSK